MSHTAGRVISWPRSPGAGLVDAHLDARRVHVRQRFRRIQRKAAAVRRDSLRQPSCIALAAVGDTAGAVGAWQAAARVSRVDPLPHFNLANVQLLRSDVGGAIQSYRAALALEPGLIAAHLNLARAYAAGGMVADAERTVRAALALEPRNEQARLLQGQLERLAPDTARRD